MKNEYHGFRQVEPHTQDKLTASAPTAARTARARADGSRNEAEPGRTDAPPTNRASDNCNIPYFKGLRWGVDSLYLSYPGELLPESIQALQARKLLAQSQEPGVPSQAQYEIGGHLFEVKDKGARLFPFVIEDGAFRIQLAKPSKTLPMAYVKVSSGYLAHVGPVVAERALRALLEQIGEVHEAANVSRIDLFVDFVTSESIEWDRRAPAARVPPDYRQRTGDQEHSAAPLWARFHHPGMSPHGRPSKHSAMSAYARQGATMET